MFEDWSVDVDQADDDDEPAAQTPVSQSKLDGIDQRLVDVLAAHRGPAGICPTVPRLAALLGVSVSTVQRALRRLVAAGVVERVPVYELPDDPEWQRRGHRMSHKGRQTSNSYRLVSLTPAPGVTEQANVPAQTPVSPDFVTPHEGKEVQPISEGRVTKAPRATWTQAAAALDRMNGRPPGRTRLLATLTPLGPVRVIAEWENEQPTPRFIGRLLDLARKGMP